MNYIKELLFPRHCPVCDNVVRFGEEKICPDCKKKPLAIVEPWCLKCGKPLKMQEQEYCFDCARGNHRFCRGRAVFTYDSMASSLYRFKYQGRQEYGEYYGETAAEILRKEKDFRQAQALVPVPLHRKRENMRGYNQAAVFARALGTVWGIPVREDLVKRIRNTKPLKQFNPSQRQNNLKKAFKLIQNDVKLNTIIIVDDIYTTGSTIDAVADVFLEAGVHRIYFVTLAVGNGF